MPRLFVALSLPQTVKQKLSLLQNQIRDARWISPQNMHLTLFFLGEVTYDQGNIVDEILEKIHFEPFTLEIDHLDCFQNKSSVQTIWAGVKKNQALMNLQEKISRRLGRETFLMPDKKKFVPHITIARFKHYSFEYIYQYLKEYQVLEDIQFEVDDFTLFESQLTQNGPIYTELRKYGSPYLNFLEDSYLENRADYPYTDFGQEQFAPQFS